MCHISKPIDGVHIVYYLVVTVICQTSIRERERERGGREGERESEGGREGRRK